MKNPIVMPSDFSISGCADFFETKLILDNCKPKTIRYYKEVFDIFSKYISFESGISSVDKKVIEKFILYLLKERKNRPSTVNNRLRGLKSFFNFCYDENLIDKKVEIKLIKEEKKVKPTYTTEELEKLLEKPNKRNCEFTEYRDWVICNFFLSTACRLNTLINIKIEDLFLKDKEVLLKHMKNIKRANSTTYQVCSKYPE